MRLGKIDSAIALLDTVSHEDSTHEVVAEALAVKIVALHVARRGSEALELAIDARARCFSAGFAAIEAEIKFGEVIGAMLLGNCAKAESAISELLRIEESEHAWIKSKTYPFSLTYWRARALDTRASIADSTGDREVGLLNNRLAIEEFDEAGIKDQIIATGLLANYANSAIYNSSADVIAFAVDRANAIQWSPSLVNQEFRVFSGIAEALSNLGDQLGALRSFRRCLDCAPTVPLQIRASVERSRLLSEIGESFSSREELDHAVRLSKSVNWETVDVSNQRQLVFLASQVAQYSGKDAERLLARYDSLTTSLSSSISLSDERFRGEEFYARGAVARATEQPARAIHLFIDAVNSFIAAKCDQRAATVATELAEMTNEPRYMAIAREHSANQPLSISAQKVARYDQSNPTVAQSVMPPSRHLTAVP